ncbi:MAG: dihydropteroate synthase [Nocardioidaceae bacterium]
MITLATLAELLRAEPDAFDHPVRPLRLGQRVVDTDETTLLMAVVNLSRDSSYRESVAVSTESAVRKARLAVAQGADLVDLGAESTDEGAAVVDDSDQAEQLVPIVTELAADGVCVSVETYSAPLAKACLEAGAQVLNYTGSDIDDEVFDLAAAHGAAVVLCAMASANVRERQDAEHGADQLLRHFEPRIQNALDRGVRDLVLDPGIGFFFGDLTDPTVRARHQTRVLLETFRLRRLGLPVCHALPHAFDTFEEEFRSAEAFFATLARLAGAGMLRTHETPQVRRVVDALAVLGP